MKKVEGQTGLNFDFDEEVDVTDDNQPFAALPPVLFEQVVKAKKVHKPSAPPLSISESPSVTLHKGGGKIVITPDDIQAAVALLEIRERIAQLANPIMTIDRQTLRMQLLPDVTPDDFAKATRAWSLVGKKTDEHPMGRLLARYGLKVNVSPSLGNWIKKEEKRLAKELTPFLLPDFKDERTLFEKVEAGMVLNCIKDFIVDKVHIFSKGQRYQVVDTARGGESGNNTDKEHEDGLVKISKTPITPGCKITLAEDTVFPWTVFHGEMETIFQYDEKIIYEPSKCVPAKYPDLVASYQKRLDAMGLELFDHVRQDVVQEALKRGTLNGKLMRMGKTSESIVCALLWGSKHVAIVAPRNARLFTVKEFQRLGLKDFVVVDSMEDLQKPATFYLLTYSWLKKNIDPHRIYRRKGQGFLHRFYTENKIEHVVEHRCPFCKRALERLVVDKKKSQETGFLLEKTVKWVKDRGFICRNQNCKCEVTFRANGGAPINGAAWGYSENAAGRIKRAKPIKLGSRLVGVGSGGLIPSFTGAQVEQIIKPAVLNKEGVETTPAKTTKFDDNYVGYINWALKFHEKCKDNSVKGRYCHQCHQADATWVPAPYRQKVMKTSGKKLAVKDYFTGVIIDEIHTIKSLDSDIGKATRSIRAKRRMGLTGTLMPNTPADSFWPLHWCFKGGSAVFPYHQKEGATQFYDTFCEYINIKRGHNLKDSRKMLPYLKNPIKFWELMSSKMVRRNYDDELVKASLAKANRYYPDIEFHRVESTMDPKQAQLMVAAINHFEQNFNQYAAQVAQAGHLLNQAMVVSQMVYLRIGATCPEYFNVKMAKAGKPAIYDGPLGGGKMSDIQNICSTKTAAGEKVVVLTDFVEMRKSLSKCLAEHNPIVFDGTWNDDERNENFEAFLEDPTRKIFIAGTRQIREGTNLSAANTVVCCDLLWEPGLMAQAWSRAFTPTAEKRTCQVYILMAKNSIDEHVYNQFYAKLAASEQALDRKVINRRAHQVDLRWFVDRVLSDRDGLLAYLKEEGEKGIYVNEKVFQVIEDREV